MENGVGRGEDGVPEDLHMQYQDQEKIIRIRDKNHACRVCHSDGEINTLFPDVTPAHTSHEQGDPGG
jgi:hypothetical protein